MDINFEYYKIFYYVAKYGNFTKAAGVMKNSQPNITRMINSLEHELQCTLFIRTNRGVKLTTEGEKLYNRVSAAMMQFRLAEEELSDHTGIEHGSIAIGVSEIALNLYLLEHLKKFHANYPGVRLKIWNHTTPQAIQAVKTGEVDLAVVTSPVRLENSLRQVCLQTFHEILVAGKTFQALNCNLRKLSMDQYGEKYSDTYLLSKNILSKRTGNRTGNRSCNSRSDPFFGRK